jgi:hypothetical protein
MSIVALKRNSRRFLAPISSAATSGGQGFSLNGGYRNQRPIGNTNLAALKKTAESCYGNDPTIVKLSCKNTKGYIYDTLWYPTCVTGGTSLPLMTSTGCMTPVQWVKPGDTLPLSKSQGVYIDQLVALTATGTGELDSQGMPCVGAPEIKNNTCPTAGTCGNTVKMNYWVGGRPICQNMCTKNGGFQGQGALISSIYTRTLLMKNNCLPTPAYAQHFPTDVLHNGCDGPTILTPAAAIEAGVLPKNWSGSASAGPNNAIG